MSAGPHVIPLHCGGLVQRTYFLMARIEGGHVVQRTITAVSVLDAMDAVHDECAANGLIVRGMSTKCLGVADGVQLLAPTWADTEPPVDDPELASVHLQGMACFHDAKDLAWRLRDRNERSAVPPTLDNRPGPSALDEMAHILASSRSAATDAAPPSWPSADMAPVYMPNLRQRDRVLLAVAFVLAIVYALAFAGALR
jgi:hypothetical protein